MDVGKIVSIKAKLREGRPVIAAMVRFPEPAIAEFLATAGFDVLIIDNEHSPFSDETIANIARACASRGAACMIRPTDHNVRAIGRFLDMGLSGILAAHVESGEQAQSIVDAVKYPPVGRRGMMPLSRAAAFGLGAPTEDYARIANEETVVTCMCETRAGVENIDAILAVEGVDGISIGPSDLANSYGMPGKINDPRIVEIIAMLRRKVIASGKFVHIQAKDHEAAVKAIADGYRWISAGSDQSLMMDSVRLLAPRELAGMKLGTANSR